MGPLPRNRRMHGVPELPMAGGVAAPYRRARRYRADRRGRPVRRRQNRIHPAARHRNAPFGPAAMLAGPGAVRLQRAAVGARFFAARHAVRFPCAVARAVGAPAIRSRAAFPLDRVREDAADGRRPEQSLCQSQCHAERQQRAHHATGRQLGGLLPRPAIFGDASTRPDQAQAPGRVRRNSLPNRR